MSMRLRFCWVRFAFIPILLGWTTIAFGQGAAVSYTATFSGLVYSRETGTFNSVLTLTNNGSASITTPIAIVVSTGAPSVTVAGTADGATYVSNERGSILPGQSVTFAVEFLDPADEAFTPRVTSVAPAPPVPSSTMTSSGGTIAITAAGNPLAGTQIFFPPEALGAPTETITGSYSSTLPAPLDPAAIAAGIRSMSLVVTLNKSGSTPLQLDVSVRIPYSIRSLGSQDYPVVLYWDSNLKQYQPVQVIGVDQANGFVIFSTKHFSSFLVVGLKGLVGMLTGKIPVPSQLVQLNTGFKPQVNGFEILNFSSGVNGIANGGACFGLSSYAGWYFAAKPSATPLYAEYQTTSDPGVTHVPQEDAVARELVAKTYSDTVNDVEYLSLPDLLSATEFLVHLLATNDPQLAYVYFRDANGNIDAHSVLVYAYALNGSTLSFTAYDPNLPAPFFSQPPPIQFSFSSSKFLPWTSAGNNFTTIEFDAYGTHYDTKDLNALFNSIQSGGPPSDSNGKGWNFNTLSIDSSAVTSVPYPGSAAGPTVGVDSTNGTKLTLTWNCPKCLATQTYYLHVLQDDMPLMNSSGVAAIPISPSKGTGSVETLPFSGSSAELIAYVSTNKSVLSGAAALGKQTDIYLGYGGFQRAELTRLGGQLYAAGISNSAIVGATCPSGSVWGDLGTCVQFQGNPPIETLLASTAAISIKGGVQPLSSLAGLSPCGFTSNPQGGTWANAISESGAIVIEGQHVEGFTELSCLLTPISGSNGYKATPLSFYAAGINSSGTIVGATCPSGSVWGDLGTCVQFQGNPPIETLLASTAAISIKGGVQPLSSLAGLSPCGFTSNPQGGTWANAISESGAIVIEGQHVEGFTELSCLLTPTGSTGANSYVATPL